ncbi:MAG: FliM/FliN family flagellar motor C-terminal domain-containing protein [Terracidiphilus sp.]|jgi:flagellar motor switch protein FliM
MATAQSQPQQVSAHSLPQHASAPQSPAGLTAGAENGGEQALVASAHTPGESERIKLTAPVARLPVELDVAVPVRDFRVRNLLALEPGQVIETRWQHGEDMPLAAGNVQLAWSEFEVIDSQLAVRVTRLA